MPYGMNDMMNGPGGMMGWGWVGMLLGFLLIVALIAALVAGTVYLVRALGRPQGSSPSGHVADQRAMQILDERYARGEIGHEEYEQRRRTLRSDREDGGDAT